MMSKPCCGPGVTVGRMLAGVTAALAEVGVETAGFEARCIVAHVLDARPGGLRDSTLLQPLQERIIGHLLALRRLRMPLNYVLGNAEFMGLQFHCDARALSPRLETELLAEVFVERIGPSGSGLLLDIGCGSGVLGLSVAHHLPRVVAVSSDVSVPALTLCRQNSQRIGLAHRVHAVAGSYLDWLSPAGAAQVRYLISNPPYVRPDDYAQLQPEIVAYEPREALVSPSSDGLGAYRQIAARLGDLTALRLAGFEIGCDQAEVVELMRQARPDLRWTVENDYSGHPRIVMGERNG